jgi:hypothetical protein
MVLVSVTMAGVWGENQIKEDLISRSFLRAPETPSIGALGFGVGACSSFNFNSARNRNGFFNGPCLLRVAG